jgi:gluconolactonase
MAWNGKAVRKWAAKGGRKALPVAVLLTLFPAYAASAQAPAAGVKTAAPEAIPSVPTVPMIVGIGPDGNWRKLGGSYVLSEGPTPAPDGTVYFTDYRGGAIYRIDGGSEAVTPLLNDIHAGGLALDAGGQILVAETRRGQILRIDPKTKVVSTVSAGIGGARFNAPNDLVVDAIGGIYFTDPANGATLPLVQGKQSVYYVDPHGKTTRVVDYLPHPNGIALSRDGKSLYVGLTSESEVLGYHVLKPGVLAPESFVFGRVAFTPPVKRGDGAYTGVDGMALDERGDLYTASKFGIEVIDPQGRSLGTIATPERPSNLKFGGTDRHTLYVTTYNSIYAVHMAVGGQAPQWARK